MSLSLKAALGSLAFLLVAACGRAVEDGESADASGGKPIGGQSGASSEHSGKGGSADGGGGIVAGGEGGEGGTSVDSIPLGESSWNTTLALTVTKAEGHASVTCSAADFTLHVSPSGNTLKYISGVAGALESGELIRDALQSPTYSVSQPQSVPTRNDCDLSGLNLTELTLQAFDDDGDGTADRISGSGKARGFWFGGGDEGLLVELGFELRGVPDTTPPSLFAPISSLHPLDGVYLRTSEPVLVTSSATLVPTAGAGESLPLVGNFASEGAFREFSSMAILPFGSTWTLSATGGDLANLPFFLGPTPPLVVLADPGIFAQDGFESAPALSLTGSARLVTSVGTLSAITGTQSLFVPSGSSATLHVARPEGASTVRLKAQLLTSSPGSAAGRYLEAGVIGGSDRALPAEVMRTMPYTATKDSSWPYAGPQQELAVSLTEPGSDVVIRIESPAACQGFCPPAIALLVDDLRLE